MNKEQDVALRLMGVVKRCALCVHVDFLEVKEEGQGVRSYPVCCKGGQSDWVSTAYLACDAFELNPDVALNEVKECGTE